MPGLAEAQAPLSPISLRPTSFFTENTRVGQGPPPVPRAELTAQGKGVWPEGVRLGACVCSCVQGTQVSLRVPLCLPHWDTSLNPRNTSYGSSALSPRTWGGSSWGPGRCAQLLLNLLSARPWPPSPTRCPSSAVSTWMRDATPSFKCYLQSLRKCSGGPVPQVPPPDPSCVHIPFMATILSLHRKEGRTRPVSTQPLPRRWRVRREAAVTGEGITDDRGERHGHRNVKAGGRGRKTSPVSGQNQSIPITAQSGSWDVPPAARPGVTRGRAPNVGSVVVETLDGTATRERAGSRETHTRGTGTWSQDGRGGGR